MAESELLRRLHDTGRTLKEIREKCRVASISAGILHGGRVLPVKNLHTGVRDVLDPNRSPPDWNTCYTLVSVSKTFVSAAFGILVDENKANWTDPVSKYIPEFQTENPKINTEATFKDLLRHVGGLSNLVVNILGPMGQVFVSKAAFMDVVNSTPLNGSPGEQFEYSGISYGLVALAIEKISGMPYANFVNDRLLKPLGMHNTALFTYQVKASPDGCKPNIAVPAIQLEDDTWITLDHEWTSEDNTPVLGMVGVRSCTRDLMIWAAAFMEARWPESNKTQELLLDVKRNPIKRASEILDDWYWTRPSPAIKDFEDVARYQYGWLRVEMPSCMVNWGSYNSLLADNAAEPDLDLLYQSVLGKTSGVRTMYKCSGIGYCGTASLNFFPATKSAVVVLANGLNCGDASDLAASLLIQELFSLSPRVDIQSIATIQCEATKREFEDNVLRPWRKNRDTSAPEQPLSGYLGDYYGLGIVLRVRLQRSGISAQDVLELCFNGRDDAIQELEYYNVDKYSYMPKDRNRWLAGGWLDWNDYMIGVLDFRRDNKGNVSGLYWKWDRDENPAWFARRSNILSIDEVE